jgi:hypothetical protein
MPATGYYARKKFFGRFNWVTVVPLHRGWGWFCLERFVPNEAFWHIPLFPRKRPRLR